MTSKHSKCCKAAVTGGKTTDFVGIDENLIEEWGCDKCHKLCDVFEEKGEIQPKKKKYEVDVRSHVNAIMTVFANSREEAVSIALKDMEESMERQLANASPNPFIRDMSGWVEALKTSVKLIK